jgi:hypothetical protein
MSISRYFLPFFLVIISGLMYVLYIAPTYTTILDLRAKKADYETAINNAEQVRDLQAKLLAEMEAIDPADQARLEKLLPSSYDPVLVLYDLNAFAQKRGLALKTPSVIIPAVDPQKSGQSSITPITVRFIVSAPYSIFRTFMADLEKELALRDILALRISNDGGEGSSLESSIFTYQVEVEGHAYKGKETHPQKS